MMNNEALLEQFRENVTRYLDTTREGRREAAFMYAMRDSHHVDNKHINIDTSVGTLNDRDVLVDEVTDRPRVVINLAAPYVRAVAGHLITDSDVIEAVASDAMFDAEMDVMSDGMEYCQEVSGFDAERAIAYEDALTRGDGATVTYLDFSHKDFIGGKPRVDRKFFTFFDNSMRGADINKNAQWVGYADPVSKDFLDGYFKRKNITPNEGGAAQTDSIYASMMEFCDHSQFPDTEFVYYYYWYEWEDVYDVENPYISMNMELMQLVQIFPEVTNLLGDISEQIQIDYASPAWSLDKESWTKFKDAIDNINMITGEELPYPEVIGKRGAKFYYRAEIARNTVISKSRSYVQDCHAMTFKVAFFDETLGRHYGLMRPLSHIQYALNRAVEDYQQYSSRTATGGNIAIEFGESGRDQFINLVKGTKQRDQVIPVPQDARIMQRGTADAAQAMYQLVQFYVDMMPKVIGLPPEFLGNITSGDTTNLLFRQIRKQMNAVLQSLFNNAHSYLRNQGYIFMAMVRVLAESNDGMLIRRISPGHGEEVYVKLSKQNLARQYAIRINPRPTSGDEQQDTLRILIELLPMIPPQAQPSIISQIIENTTLDMQDKQKLLQAFQQALTPQPVQPDPIAIEMQKANLRMIHAQASKLEADAQKDATETQYMPQDMQSQIQENLAQAEKYKADALNTGVKNE